MLLSIGHCSEVTVIQLVPSTSYRPGSGRTASEREWTLYTVPQFHVCTHTVTQTIQQTTSTFLRRDIADFHYCRASCSASWGTPSQVGPTCLLLFCLSEQHRPEYDDQRGPSSLRLVPATCCRPSLSELDEWTSGEGKRVPYWVEFKEGFLNGPRGFSDTAADEPEIHLFVCCRGIREFFFSLLFL